MGVGVDGGADGVQQTPSLCFGGTLVCAGGKGNDNLSFSAIQFVCVYVRGKVWGG